MREDSWDILRNYFGEKWSVKRQGLGTFQNSCKIDRQERLSLPDHFLTT